MHKSVQAVQAQLQALPTVLRHAAVGAALVGVPTGVAGFVIGLFVHWPTAWAAALELGVPGALVGGVLGVLVGFFASLLHGAGKLGDPPRGQGSSRLSS